MTSTSTDSLRLMGSCNFCKEQTNHKIIAQKVAKNGCNYLVRKCEKCQKNNVG